MAVANQPTLVFVHGSWHTPACYNKIIKSLQDEHKIRCVAFTLPSTTGDSGATFKDDIDAARKAIASETAQGRDVIVIAHSYGGMVDNSAIKGFAKPPPKTRTTSDSDPTSTFLTRETSTAAHGHVVALVLIASGFTITGLAFMDPFFGIPPPSWRFDKPSGYAVLVAYPRELFYHDLPSDEASYWIDQLKPQSTKALLEGGEHAYAGWQDVPTWYIGTIEDRGLPVVAQRIIVAMARAQGGVVYHTELKSSHSPFLSMPDEVVAVILNAVDTVSGGGNNKEMESAGVQSAIAGKRAARNDRYASMVKFNAPRTWFSFGLPFLIGHMLGWGYIGFMKLRKLWRR